jgi:nucleoside-diphosphate-sugar epimerase
MPEVSPMRVFLAGASGVIGVRLIPLLVADGHQVAGMTRSPGKAATLRELGAAPVVCDVFDASALAQAVVAFGPALVMHQLTDLPDQVGQIAEFAAGNNRIRTEGTRNLLAAAEQADATRFLAQSIAWTPPAGGEAVAEHERMVLNAGGVVIRYGTFYGPGTYSGPGGLPPPPRIHVDEAARRTITLLKAPPGVVVIAEDR